jgi:hypothetical protein
LHCTQEQRRQKVSAHQANRQGNVPCKRDPDDALHIGAGISSLDSFGREEQ